MANQQDRLRLALVALHLYRTPKRLLTGLSGGLDVLEKHWGALVDDVRDDILAEAQDLQQQGIDVILTGDERYPAQLASVPGAPPLLFFWGNQELLHAPSVGMCGSRQVSVKGLAAARTCGHEVASHGLTIVSGYAKGVDTETHLTALESGGRTIIVLAEGIRRFRVKRPFRAIGLDSDRVLVLSQFGPSQPWNVGGAMARNAVIVGLGRALVVIEAGAKGGTLDAGFRALSAGRPVLALDFTEGTPAGNKILFDRGAVRIDRRAALGKALDIIEDPDGAVSEQLSLM